MVSLINQAFGKNWAFYNGDCVVVMEGLPDNLIDFGVHSPPFCSLYIYTDSIADLGNTDSESQFFEGYRFAIKEMYRVHKPGRYVAVHCKDIMRYMSSHGYAGLYDFPGDIIRAFQAEGFLFSRWITIWKDPVIEMQRTKTYGLLHKSFCERAEVTRQGCADYVLIFRKPECDPSTSPSTSSGCNSGRGGEEEWQIKLPPANEAVIERCVEQWTNAGEHIHTPLNSDLRNRYQYEKGQWQYSFWSKPSYNRDLITLILNKTTPGRLATIHCALQMMTTIIGQFEAVTGWKFHSRTSLTDGTYLVTFRNWRGEFESGIVKHSLKAPKIERYQYQANEGGLFWFDADQFRHTDYVGTEPPVNWHDDTYYSILVWQKYASPVWFDLSGLPESHPDILMDINQTNVLNARLVRDEKDEKHICPLQLDLIERLISEYTHPGETVLSCYGGIGSEGYQSAKMGRKAILAELKSSYWRYSVKVMRELEIEMTQVDLFSLVGLQV